MNVVAIEVDAIGLLGVVGGLISRIEEDGLVF